MNIEGEYSWVQIQHSGELKGYKKALPLGRAMGLQKI